MKNLLVLSLILISGVLSAQRIQLVFNYTDGIYRGLTYSAIVADEDDFIKDKPRYEGNFLDEFFEIYKGIAYLPDTINSNEPIVKIDILQVTPKGTVKAAVNYNGETTYISGKGGHIGTFLNLFGDGMKSLGKNVALFLNNANK